MLFAQRNTIPLVLLRKVVGEAQLLPPAITVNLFGQGTDLKLALECFL